MWLAASDVRRQVVLPQKNMRQLQGAQSQKTLAEDTVQKPSEVALMGSCPHCHKHVTYALLEDHEDGGFKCPHCGKSMGLTVDGRRI